MTLTTRLLSPLLAMLALGVPLASTEELAIGGYAAGPAAGLSSAGGAEDLPASVELGDGGAMVLDFTPRGGGLFEPEQPGSAPRVRFELSLAGKPAGSPDAFEMGAASEPSWLVEPRLELGELSMGGALRWSEWSVGGGFARTALMGGEADLVAATVGYGSLTARLGFGEAETVQSRPPLDVLMLSTDLVAASWLTLESDVALGTSQAEEESVAVGRLGVRLNF